VPFPQALFVEARERPERPRISFVVVGWRMAVQASNTLHSLSLAHQKNVGPDDYEVIFVENRSDELVSAEAALAHGASAYLLRDDTSESPVFALCDGVARARAPYIGVLLDAAHLVTPRVVEFALVALRLATRAVVVVPTFHLGPGPQHETHAKGYSEAEERRLLADADWRVDAARLFARSTPVGCADGSFMLPFHEPGCFVLARESAIERAPALERFAHRGGSGAATFMVNEACKERGSEAFVLPGEAAFHQFHGGLTSSGNDRRAELLARAELCLDAESGGERYQLFSGPICVLGVVQGHAHKFLAAAVSRARPPASIG
jgi:hypothetical protein